MKTPFPIDKVRESILRLMEETGEKPKPLAAKLKLSDTGIRDIFLDKTKSVSSPKLNIIANHFGVTIEEIISGNATTKKSSRAISKELLSSERIPLLGKVAAGVWLEQTYTDVDDFADYDRMPGDSDATDLFAVELAGDSMNLRFRDNILLICRRIPFGFSDVVAGKYYIIERENHDLREMTCKRVEVDENGDFLLCSESSNPRYADPIRVPKSHENEYLDNGVTVIGRVIRAVDNLN